MEIIQPGASFGTSSMAMNAPTDGSDVPAVNENSVLKGESDLCCVGLHFWPSF
jgi:hypothetical protein